MTPIKEEEVETPAQHFHDISRSRQFFLPASVYLIEVILEGAHHGIGSVLTEVIGSH